MSDIESSERPSGEGWRGWDRPPAKKASPWPNRLIVGGIVAAFVIPAIWGAVWFFDGLDDLRSSDGQAFVDYAEVGDCLGDTSTLGPGEEFTFLPELPCSEPHLGEIYVSILLPEGATSVSAHTRYLDSRCEEQFESFVGIDADDSELSWWYFTPIEEDVEYGARTVKCVVESREKVVGTLKDSRR